MQDKLLDRKGGGRLCQCNNDECHCINQRRAANGYQVSIRLQASTRLKFGHIVHLFVEINAILLTRRRLFYCTRFILASLRTSLSFCRHADVTASPDAYV